MSNEISDAFNATYADGPSTAPTNPPKSAIRALGRTIQTSVDAANATAAAAQTTADGAASTAGNALSTASDAYAAAAAGIVPALTEVAAGQTTALPANTYANGTAGVGATITGNVNGALTNSYFDSVSGAITVGKRLWVNLEGAKNGIYTVTQVGDASHPFVLTRATDADTASKLGACTFTLTAGGATYGGKRYQCQQKAASITVGTTALTFALLNDNSGVASEVAAARGDEISVVANIESVRDRATAVVPPIFDKLGRLPAIAFQDPAGNRADAEPYAWLRGQSYAYNDSSFIDACFDASVLNIIIIMGQSNGEGSNQNHSDTLVASSALYPSLAWSLPSGVRPAYGTSTLHIRYSSLIPLVETQNSDFQETAASGCVNHLIAKVAAATGINLNFAAMVPAIGGLNFAQLKRGSQSYKRFQMGLDDICRAAILMGLRPRVLAVNWMGNEGNSGTSPYETAANHVKMVRDLREDIACITGQAEPWVYYIDAIRRANGAFDNRMQTGAELAASRDPMIRLSQPCYQHPSVVGTEIHMTCAGQNARGQALARAIFAEQFGIGWQSFNARRVWRSGSAEISAEFGVPAGNLVLDTSGSIVATTGLPGYYGFLFDDGSGSAPAITGHSFNGYKMVYTLASAPTGTFGRLSYANAPNTGEGRDGPVYGARGCLRNDVADVNLYTSASHYDWCLPFVRDIAI